MRHDQRGRATPDAGFSEPGGATHAWDSVVDRTHAIGHAGVTVDGKPKDGLQPGLAAHGHTGRTFALIQITAHNRGPEPAEIHLLPTLWFRNTWSWRTKEEKPELKILAAGTNARAVTARHRLLGERFLYCGRRRSVVHRE